MATQKDVMRECLFAIHPTPWRVGKDGPYPAIIASNGGTVRIYNESDIDHARMICAAANKIATRI